MDNTASCALTDGLAILALQPHFSPMTNQTASAVAAERPQGSFPFLSPPHWA